MHKSVGRPVQATLLILARGLDPSPVKIRPVRSMLVLARGLGPSLVKIRPVGGMLALVCGLGLFVAAGGPAAAQQHAGQYDQVDIEYGAQIFAQRCVVCHGERGDLLPEANLRSGTYRNASSDRELSRVIANGVPNTAMVPTGYTGAELTALVAYLRNITTWDPSVGSVALGDPDRGRELAEGAGGCIYCHRIGAEGPRYAPALTDAGARLSAATIRRILLDPSGAMLPANRPVRAVTEDGEVIVGRRLNEDTFTVQLITQDERLVALDKTTLQEYTIGTESAMQPYGEIFDEAELADLLAWVLTLQGFER